MGPTSSHDVAHINARIHHSLEEKAVGPKSVFDRSFEHVRAEAVHVVSFPNLVVSMNQRQQGRDLESPSKDFYAPVNMTSEEHAIRGIL